MGYHPRQESKTQPSFITTRSRNSRLWFVNNPELEHAILGHLAKCLTRREAKIYAFAIEGNHNQGPALFPKGNRSDFMRDLNSSIARAVQRHTPEYDGGRFWGRRYSAEVLPGEQDVEEYFFYTVLQPVKDGHVEKISQYPGYNCFNDAIWGNKRKFKVVNWSAYNAARRRYDVVNIKDYTEIVTLQYERLPGYEDMTQLEYVKMMRKKLEERRLEIVNDRLRRGLGFSGPEKLKQVKRGAYPYRTKTSDINTHRPRVLSICPIRRREALDGYFKVYYAYKDASDRYRKGELTVAFPEGTYRPPMRYEPPPDQKMAA